MPPNLTITDAGAPTYTQPQFRAAAVEDWRAKFGDDANTAPDATDGQEIDLVVTPEFLIWQQIVRTRADSFVRTAQGQALDAILDAFGLKRIPAAPSSGAVVFYGAELTAVAVGVEVQTTGSAARFATTAAGSTGALLGSDVWMGRIPGPVEIGTTFTATVAGAPFVHLATTTDPKDTRDALRTAINGGVAGDATAAGSDDGGRALLVIDVAGGPGVVTIVDDAAANPDPDEFPAVRLSVQALESGPVTAPSGTLQFLPSPIAGITGASNGTDAAQGRDVESDDEFRARHLDSLGGAGCGTDQAIRQAILDTRDAQGVKFVETANVTSNRNFSPTDSEGRPKSSFESAMRYSASAPADADQRVAQQIASCMPAGIEPFGLTWTETVDLPGGSTVNVSGTLIATLYLHLEITVGKGENFPTAGNPATAIAEAVTNAWDQITLEGKDYQRSASVGPASVSVNNTITTIAIRSDLTPLPGDVPTFASVDTQPASAREIIDLDASRVTVIIL